MLLLDSLILANNPDFVKLLTTLVFGWSFQGFLTLTLSPTCIGRFLVLWLLLLSDDILTGVR